MKLPLGKNRALSALPLITACVLGAAFLQPQEAEAVTNTLLRYDFSGTVDTGAGYAPDFEDTEVSGSIVSKGPGLSSIPPSADIFYVFGWPTGGAIDPNDYIEFTITPGSGTQITYNHVTFAWVRNSSGPGDIDLRSSVDGYTATLDSAAAIPVGPGQPQSFDVSGLGTQTGPVTFRLYSLNAPAPTGSAGFAGPGFSGGQSLVIGGTTSPAPVVEPVPTLTEWGIFSLILLLAGAAFIHIRKLQAV